MKKLIVISLISLAINAVCAQQSTIDSIKHELAIAKEDTNKVHLLSWLSNMYLNSSADTGVAYAQQALDLANKLGFRQGTVEAEGTLALTLIISGNYPLGLDHSFKTLERAREVNPLLVPWAISLVSWCYYYLGEYDTCLRYTREAFSLAKDYELPYGWRDLSLVYHSLKQSDSALYYGKKAYAKLRGLASEGNISFILGDAYVGKGNYDSALLIYKSGVSVSKKNGWEIDLIDNYDGIAAAYKSMNVDDSAITYAKKVLSEKIEKKYPIGLLKAANLLADIYESQNKTDSSLKYLRIALAVKDSLFSREKTMASQNVAFKEQEKQQEIRASELRYQNRLRMYSLLGGLLAVMVIAGILFRNNRNKQRVNALLKEQKAKVEITLTELRLAQTQLIQSEKMASLGELTAGIAHEIQNPLNFINNFSEVNAELIDEMRQEMDKGNFVDVKAISDDIKENEQKINHHGKRADGIVKGMLQHSRTNSGQKEPTDINALADEYLRLAYHGLRAKDNSFNAAMKTDFDEKIGKINIVPQDIGRVILNLITNAFYAVGEKASANQANPAGPASGPFEPTVSVSTRKVGDRIEIRVTDNGRGIPKKVLDKVFQPFFTTKPTGQGTGLGLSLSYDIVRAHGGELTVETTSDVGTVFVIQIPSK